ncbi:histidine kinase, partial [Actinoplanes sp. NPDC051633]|uniref:sensor histidine kinase n=1 Tax=Actinoplanes sp. NPDC051633 TaxID=3155670 RepID=UPI0034343FD2
MLGGLTAAWLVGVHAWAIDDPFSGLALIAVSTVLGLYVRARRRLYDELVERAESAERERDLLAERARAEERERELLAERARADERVRLAGEMHDVVTHRISLMVLQAGALEVTSDEPEVRAASQDLREAGVQALAELRDLVGVLRTGEREPAALPAGGPGRSPPAVRRISDLVEESRSVGLEVELSERGEPAVAAPTVRRALYRVVQESLTNVHKHAPGSCATVDVVYAPHRVAVDVRNTAPADAGEPALAVAGGGAGLDGLRQRVEMLGGQMSALPATGGGFHVSASMPAFVPAPAAPPTAPAAPTAPASPTVPAS